MCVIAMMEILSQLNILSDSNRHLHRKYIPWL